MSDVEARLRRMSGLSAEWRDSEAGRHWSARESGRARREAVVDMSRGAVDARLRAMARAAALCAELGEIHRASTRD